jgi:hypothetical protein
MLYKVYAVGGHRSQESCVLDPIYKKEQKSVMRLNVRECTFEPATPLLFDRLTVEHCNSTIFDSFFYLLFEGFLIKVSQVAGHFAAAQKGQTAKHVGDESFGSSRNQGGTAENNIC